jgi:hypothetical protein
MDWRETMTAADVAKVDKVLDQAKDSVSLGQWYRVPIFTSEFLSRPLILVFDLTPNGWRFLGTE